MNDEQDTPLGIEMLDSMTRKKRTSANGTTIGSEDVPEKQDMVDGTRKRQRTGDVGHHHSSLEVHAIFI